jgi:hypothetical protein
MTASITETLTSSFGTFTIRNSVFEISERPQQVFVVKHLVKCIRGDSGNYLAWHTTGSDKTSSKGEARWVSVSGANQFNHLLGCSDEENTNTAAHP